LPIVIKQYHLFFLNVSLIIFNNSWNEIIIKKEK
jgi:hypothetical protein